jgi:TonB family protein
MLRSLTLAASLVFPSQEPSPTPPPASSETAAPAEGATRTKDGHHIKEPQKTKNVPPKWPDNARRVGLNGRVVLECVIGIDGRVDDMKVVSGYSSLAEAAKEAVAQWRYTTTELDGKAVPVIMTITVNFVLQGPPRRGDVFGSLGDADAEIRWAAMKWLGRFRPVTPEQMSAFRRGLEDSSELVRKAAQEALQNLQTQ